MPRIRRLIREEAPPEAQSAFDANVQAFGQVLNTTGIYAHRPSIMAGRLALARGIEESGLIPPRLRSLICVYVATLVGCPY